MAFQGEVNYEEKLPMLQTFSPSAPSTPPKQVRRFHPRPVLPRLDLDLDKLRNEKIERGCMSKRHMDAPGILRLMKLAPTTLPPGSVHAMLDRLAQADETPELATQIKAEVAEWQQKTYKRLQACQDGLDESKPEELEAWIARAEALLPANAQRETNVMAPLSLELVTSAKELLEQRARAEKQETLQRLTTSIRRLNGTAPKKDEAPEVAIAFGHVGSNKSITVQEAQVRMSKFRLGDRLLDQMQTRSALNSAGDFRKALIKKFETFEQAWDQLDTNGNGLMDFNEFVTSCRKLHIIGNMHKIFDELSSNGENVQITDLDASLAEEHRKRTQEYDEKLKRRKTLRQSSSFLPVLDRLTKKKDHSHKEMFDQKVVRSFSKDRLPYSSKQEIFSTVRSGVVATMGEVQYMMNHGCNASGGDSPCAAKYFLEALVKKYESVEAGWDDLDRNRNGALIFNEFVLGCRKLQVRGNLRQMFMELCSDGGFKLKLTDLRPGMEEEQARREQAAAERRLLRQKQEQAGQGHRAWRDLDPNNESSPRSGLFSPTKVSSVGPTPPVNFERVVLPAIAG